MLPILKNIQHKAHVILGTIIVIGTTYSQLDYMITDNNRHNEKLKELKKQKENENENNMKKEKQ